MNYLEAVQRAIGAIENALPDSVSAEQIIADTGIYYNEYHFLHIFSETVGISLGAYIRFRRMSLAGADVWNNRERNILEIALDYGYSTNESFSRAFRSFHGALPNEVRRSGIRRHFNPQKLFSGGIPMKNITETVTTILSDEQRKALKKAAKAYIKKIEAVRAEICQAASQLPQRIAGAGGATEEAEFLSKKITAYAMKLDRDIQIIRERYVECTQVAANDSAWDWVSWYADPSETDQLLALELKANALLVNCGLAPMREYGYSGHVLPRKAEQAAEKYCRALQEVTQKIMADINQRDEPDTSDISDTAEGIVRYPLPDSARDVCELIRGAYAMPAAMMLADSIEHDCTHTRKENLSIYFAGVKMFVNNEYGFAGKTDAFKELNAKLDKLADTDFRSSISGDVLQHTIYTSSLMRYAIFNLKATLLNPAYTGNDFNPLRGLMSEVEVELNKDDRGYATLTSATFELGDEGVAYVNGHDPDGKMDALLKELQTISKDKTLFEQYYGFIKCCVIAHDNVEGNEW